MSDAVDRLSGARRQESLQWRMFYISMGLGLVTGLLAALLALSGTGMLNPPNYGLWLVVTLIGLAAGFIHYMCFKLALRRQFSQFLNQFYALIGEPPPQLARLWESTELDDIEGLFNDLIRRLKDYIKREAELSRLQRYFSPEVAAQISAAGDGQDHAERMSVSVLFCDIRGFTTLSESLPADEIVKLLNAYFTEVIELIYAERGTVLKLIGDGVMAVFGAPIPFNDDVERAARVACQIPAAFDRVAAEWSRQTGHPLPKGVGVGVARGEVVVGNIGSPKHLDYTVIGDTVNVASRLCGVATARQVLITAAGAAALAENGQTAARPLGSVTVKGKEQPVEIAELTAPGAAVPA